MTTEPTAATAAYAPPLTAQERAWLIVNHPRVAMDLEQNIVAAIAAAEQAARQAQMESDCAAMFGYCYASIHQADMMPAASLSVSAAYVAGGEPEWMWVHDIRHASGETQTDDCKARSIHAAAVRALKEPQ